MANTQMFTLGIAVTVDKSLGAVFDSLRQRIERLRREANGVRFERITAEVTDLGLELNKTRQADRELAPDQPQTWIDTLEEQGVEVELLRQRYQALGRTMDDVAGRRLFALPDQQSDAGQGRVPPAAAIDSLAWQPKDDRHASVRATLDPVRRPTPDDPEPRPAEQGRVPPAATIDSLAWQPKDDWHASVRATLSPVRRPTPDDPEPRPAEQGRVPLETASGALKAGAATIGMGLLGVGVAAGAVAAGKRIPGQSRQQAFAAAGEKVEMGVATAGLKTFETLRTARDGKDVAQGIGGALGELGGNLLGTVLGKWVGKKRGAEYGSLIGGWLGEKAGGSAGEGLYGFFAGERPTPAQAEGIAPSRTVNDQWQNKEERPRLDEPAPAGVAELGTAFDELRAGASLAAQGLLALGDGMSAPSASSMGAASVASVASVASDAATAPLTSDETAVTPGASESKGVRAKMGVAVRSVGKPAVLGAVSQGLATFVSDESGPEKAEGYGGAVGGLVGTLVGGAIGSVVPVLGTTFGAALGGMVGDAVGGWVGKLWFARDKGSASETKPAEARRGISKDVREERAAPGDVVRSMSKPSTPSQDSIPGTAAAQGMPPAPVYNQQFTFTSNMPVTVNNSLDDPGTLQQLEAIARRQLEVLMSQARSAQLADTPHIAL